MAPENLMLLFLQYLPHILAVCAMVFAFVLVLICQKRIKAVEQKHTHQLQQVTKQLVISRSEIKELRTAILGMGKKITGLESVTSEVSEKQEEMELLEPDSKLYSRAVKMVELGANAEEVMKECELPQAEAELLVSLHNKGD